jgi:hypothetical protein
MAPRHVQSWSCVFSHANFKANSAKKRPCVGFWPPVHVFKAQNLAHHLFLTLSPGCAAAWRNVVVDRLEVYLLFILMFTFIIPIQREEQENKFLKVGDCRVWMAKRQKLNILNHHQGIDCMVSETQHHIYYWLIRKLTRRKSRDFLVSDKKLLRLTHSRNSHTK